ncbi:MAG TPA: 50S ribosomal protein L9 [Gammaproteobacteria bacterium]|nr:50S ribosomal protein L9 [Gammaproteobacteria bacterium]
MEVILLERVRNLGALGDVVNVKAGYGRNFLIPGGKAVSATAANKAKFEARRAELEKAAAAGIKAAEARKEALLALGAVTLNVKAGEEGKLFGSIGTRDLAAAITRLGVEVSRNEIHLPSGVLRQTGEYDIEVEFHSDVVVAVKFKLVAEGEKHAD